MEHKAVVKAIEIISAYLIILSIMELAFIMLLLLTEFNVSPEILPLQELIFSSDFISISGSILWMFLIICMVFFLILGIHMLRFALNNKIKSKPLAKYLVLLGMVLLLGAFVKMDYLVLLGKTEVETSLGSMPFQTALYDNNITPLASGVIWVFFISVIICFLITGLLVTTAGIKWTLLFEREKSS
ncbi:MAG: hypothetical protein ACFFAO_08365 [Candidatus Hermodarchaeota archaeon]